MMELHKGRETGDRKRTARLRVGGDGVRIEGVLVWGGTLAIASLMALFTVRAKKRVSSRCPCGPEKRMVEAAEEGGGGEGEENGGLRIVLQDQSSPTSPLTPRNSSCCIGGSDGGSSKTELAHLDYSDSASGQSSTSEEKPAIERDEEKVPHQETVFSDGAKTETVASFSDYSMVEDGSPPAMQDPALATDDWNENTQNHLEKQIIHASSEVDAFDHAAQEELMAEEDESVDSGEEEEQDGGDGGGGNEHAEEVEGSSEESGDSCLELNKEAIWPLEMIERAAKTIIEDQVDATKINKQENYSIIHEEGEEDNVGDDSENPGDLTALPKHGLEEPIAGIHQTAHFLRPPSIWIWCVLLLLVMLSLLVHSSSIRSFAMNRGDLCVK